MLRKNYAIVATVTVLLLFMVFARANEVMSVTPHTGTAIWVEPTASTFTAWPGYLFNVTVYINSNASMFTYQVGIDFNASQLFCTRGGYTATSTSQLFAGHTTVPVSVTPDNTNGFVSGGETLLGGTDFVAASNGSVIWVEFRVKSGPPLGGVSTGTIAVDPSSNNNFILDPSLNNVLQDNFNATYTLVSDSTPPTIQAPVQNPLNDSVTENQTVTVSANVTDTTNPPESGVKNVTLSYLADSGNWTNIAMNLVSGNLWNATIPGQLNGTVVQYNITAFDNAENMAVYPVAPPNLQYTVIPEYTAVMMIVILMAMTAAAVMLRKKSAIPR